MFIDIHGMIKVILGRFFHRKQSARINRREKSIHLTRQTSSVITEYIFVNT